MKGKLYIDGDDAFLKFGIFVEEKGYKGLAQWPALKPVDYNDWPEQDGIEVDLSGPVLDTREFSVSFCCLDTVKTADLLNLLSGGSYHDFDFREITWRGRLRLTSQPDKRVLKRLELFSLQFADDFPLKDYVYAAPLDCRVTQTGYEIDGQPFAAYGIWILEGTDTELQKAPAVKRNLLVSGNNRAGAVYDGENVFFQSKDVKVKCLLHAPDTTTFWQNYDALLYDLTKPGERQFYTEAMGEEYPCYYKSAAVNRFEPLRNGRIWCEFVITLVFTSFRIGATEYVLASEDGERICTEDGEFLIDLKY